MYIAKINGNKCYLSPIDINDSEKLAVWLNDFDITDNLSSSTSVITVESQREVLKTISKSHHYAIVDGETNQMIGVVGLKEINQIHRSAELAVFIGDKTYRRRGFGSEASLLLIDYAFKYLNINSIMLRVYSFNTGAIACYEKMGFKKVGELREAIYRNLKYHNLIFMDILASDYYNK